MLHEHYDQLVKGLDLVSHDDAVDIVRAVLTRVRGEIGANAVNVWMRISDESNRDVLQVFAASADYDQNLPRLIVVDDNAKGLLPWAVEQRRAVWLDDVRTALPLADRISSDAIEERYLRFDDNTRSILAIPIIYHEQLRGIIVAQSGLSHGFTDYHFELIKTLMMPTAIMIWKSAVTEENHHHTRHAIEKFKMHASRPSSSLNPYRTGFIARPFEPGFGELAAALTGIFKDFRIRAESYSQSLEGTLVITDILAKINATHFAILDITGLKPNVLIELGAVIHSEKKFLLLQQNSDQTRLPFNISGFPVFKYLIDHNEITVIQPSGERLTLKDCMSGLIDQLLREKGAAFQDAKEWL